MKEQEKTPEKQLNEVEIGNLPEKEFRIMIVKMIQDLGLRMEAASITVRVSLPRNWFPWCFLLKRESISTLYMPSVYMPSGITCLQESNACLQESNAPIQSSLSPDFSRLDERLLVLQPGIRAVPLRWESQLQDTGPQETSQLHVIPNCENLSEISISTSRPSFTQRPASYSAGHPMPNN